MGPMFKKISQEKVSDRIFNEIKALIVKEELRPGQQIPPELELTTLFDVSRSSVREAVLKLECLGFVEQRRGEGTFVRSVTQDPVENYGEELKKNDHFLSGLMEIRGVLETWAASAAAKRATRDDIRDLRKIVDDMQTSTVKKPGGHALNVRLHSAIAAATHNPFLIHMMGSILELLESVTERVYANAHNDAELHLSLTRQHAAIVSAIEQGDPREASLSMADHLAFSLRQAGVECATGNNG